jgi:hypothetical protein
VKLRFDTGAGDLYLGLADDLTLLAGVGRHKCSAPLAVDGSRLPSDAVLEVAGEVSLDGLFPSWLGPCWLERPITTHNYEFDSAVIFELPGDALAQLESLRNGGDLALRYQLHVIVRGVGHGWPMSQQTPVRVPAFQWAQQLHNLGAAAALTVVVPAPLSEGPRREIGTHLRDAREAIDHQRYDDAVRHARLALDVLAGLDPPPSRKAVDQVEPQLRPPQLRWAALHHDMQSLASAAHHGDPIAATFTWTRADAIAVVAAIAALAARGT